MDEDFRVVLPASLQKSSDGSYKVAGLASTEDVDRQGEVLVQKGIDLTPIEQGKGYLNFEHSNLPENLIGTVDSYKRGPEGLFIEGTLFKNHSRANAIREVMSSLGEKDRGRVGLSVEGKVLERDAENPSIVKKCQIKNVALTFSPVNSNTYADLVKSMAGSADLDWQATKENSETNSVATENTPIFSSKQVIELVQKALGTGDAGMKAPEALSGGEALTQESTSKKKKKLKKMTKEVYKSNIIEVMDKIQKLYPMYSREVLWKAFKERLTTKFPELSKM